MQNPKKNAGDKSQTDEVGGHQQRAKKTAKRDDVRSVVHDLMWVPIANDYMLIL
ncbi:hypothetical protein PMI26_05436 [Pseudomonas sp. GM33]|uniref:hypothetical protein n=1 Tax=Pseudomonas sp. GM33 TaxID=1144329 RepID=UPI0002703CEB|nr:hypothetical protein [Pseudomonas sp. GM33]EJM35094.1 hypothetical protein PMI26_05436 [Pseudomonas sp. GM33]